jgi:hypothetical protein
MEARVRRLFDQYAPAGCAWDPTALSQWSTRGPPVWTQEGFAAPADTEHAAYNGGGVRIAVHRGLMTYLGDTDTFTKSRVYVAGTLVHEACD